MSFFYNIVGDKMKIYVDLVLLLNFLFDLILLITTTYILKRNVKSYRLIFSALIGSLSTFFLFINISGIVLFIYKMILSFVMIIISFGYKNIKYFIKNLTYFYVVSILLGGFLYFLNITFSYKNNGLVFYNNGISINFIFLLIASPIILVLYSKQVKDLKYNFSNYYKVNLKFNNHKINLNAYLDTGNTLVDPYLNKPVFILNKKKMIYDINEFKMVLVPYKTINGTNTLNCIIIDELEIIGFKTYKKAIVGLIEENININGVDMILNSKIQEDLC